MNEKRNPSKDSPAEEQREDVHRLRVQLADDLGYLLARHWLATKRPPGEPQVGLHTIDRENVRTRRHR